MVHGQEDRDSLAEITEGPRSVQAMRDGVAGCEQIVLDEDVIVVVWPMS